MEWIRRRLTSRQDHSRRRLLIILAAVTVGLTVACVAAYLVAALSAHNFDNQNLPEPGPTPARQ